MAYRDPTAGHRLRLRALADEVSAIEGGLRPVVARLLPSALAEALATSRRRWAQTRPQVERAELDAEVLQAALTQLEAYRALLEQLLALLPDLRAKHCLRPDAAPTLVPELMPQRQRQQYESTYRPLQTSWEMGREEVQAALEVLAAADVRVRPRVSGSLDVVATFSLAGVPYALRRSSDPWELATGIPTAAAPLRLRPQLYRHSILLKPLGLARDLEFGELLFDELFLVEADDEDEARIVLDPGVRAALLELAAWSVPTLTLADGVCSLLFAVSQEGCATGPLKQACALLATIRATPILGELSNPEGPSTSPS